MKILSSHRSHHTPLQRSSPRDLAKTIARDETNMSTMGIVLANYSSTEYAAVLSCLLLHFYLFSYLYILDEKDKKRFITIFKEITIFIIYPKLFLFPDHNSSWSFYLHNSYHSIWYSWVRTFPPFHILYIFIKLLQNLAHGLVQPPNCPYPRTRLFE